MPREKDLTIWNRVLRIIQKYPCSSSSDVIRFYRFEFKGEAAPSKSRVERIVKKYKLREKHRTFYTFSANQMKKINMAPLTKALEQAVPEEYEYLYFETSTIAIRTHQYKNHKVAKKLKTCFQDEILEIRCPDNRHVVVTYLDFDDGKFIRFLKKQEKKKRSNSLNSILTPDRLRYHELEVQTETGDGGGEYNPRVAKVSAPPSE